MKNIGNIGAVREQEHHIMPKFDIKAVPEYTEVDGKKVLKSMKVVSVGVSVNGDKDEKKENN